jgi:hypothetical protein
MKKVFIISFFCFFVGVFVFLLALNGNVERVKLLEAIANRKIQVEQVGEPISYQKKQDGSLSHVIIPNGPKAFFEIVISVLSRQALIMVKINSDKNSKPELETAFQNIAESEAFKNQVIFVSINPKENQNYKILEFLENKLRLNEKLDLPVFVFFHNNHLLLPLQPGVANKTSIEKTIQRFLNSEAFNETNSAQQRASSERTQRDRIYHSLNSNFDNQLALNKVNKRSIWKHNSGLYKNFNALF